MQTSLVSTSLLAVIVACALYTSGGALAQYYNDAPTRYQQGSFFDTILSPIRAIHRQAKHLIGPHMPGLENFIDNRFDSLQAQTFKLFMQIYNKTYTPAEIPKRMRLFFERRKAIENSVKEYAAGRLSFVMHENPYIDWDEREIKMLTGVSPPKSLQELTSDEREAVFGVQSSVPKVFSVQSSGILPGANEASMMVKKPAFIPRRVDWRESGCVGAPVHQQRCGCCYAIATMTALETMHCVKKISSPSLSAQQIIDCATPRAGYQNFGCDGGWPTRVFKYLQNVGVAARDSCYPLVLRQQQCKLKRISSVSGCVVAASPSNNSRLRYKVLNNERDILYHVAKTGPVVTVMKATDKFLMYGSGIFNDIRCSRRADDVDHAIVIVGYGSENGQDYWLIKNSWGTDWGIKGYGKYLRGSNACSIGHWGWVILD